MNKEYSKMYIWLSPTKNPYGHPNPKWVARDPKSASNRVPIRETYFGLSERHNPNMGSFLLKTHLQKRFFFGSCCWRRCRIGIEPFACSATQRTNESCILNIVVRDSLTMTIYLKSWVVLELTDATSRCSM